MTFLNLAKKRYSVRHYTSQKVEIEKLEQILAAAQAAPTACNKQPVHMLIIQEENGSCSVRSVCRLPLFFPHCA